MRMATSVWITVFTLLLLSTSASAETIEFKGLKPGATLHDAGNRFFCEEAKTTFADVRCHLKFNQPETIAGAPASLVLVYLIDQKITSISVVFKNENYDAIKRALQSKYGPGTTEQETLTNRMGAAFDNEIVKWVDGNDSMTIKRYSGKIDTGSMEIHNTESVAKFVERKRKQDLKNASDL